ncbi:MULTISPECIES: hypothetical protein [unclassified Pseudomonas]|uniref:hypothetical protein n=1 Tax=unclassified Pseudomonas TaxID=196821 RepID=UPI001F57BEFC|nr:MULTISPECIES: hypothetical protein [unclassified Pseudomonas]
MQKDKRVTSVGVGDVQMFLATPDGESFTVSIRGREFLEHNGEYFRFKFFQYLGKNEFYIGSGIDKKLPLNVPHSLGNPGTAAHVQLELDGIDNSRSAKGFVCLERGGDYPKGVIYCSEEKAFSLIAMFDFKNS